MSIVIIAAERLRGARVLLEPVTDEAARAVLGGSFAGVPAGRSWPGTEVLDVLRMAVEDGGEPGWFVVIDGLVVGECGTKGPPFEGEVEIRYGIAAPYRCRGLASEACGALTTWLLAQHGVERVVASVHLGNVASRRVLERCGFAVDRMDGPDAWYSRGC